MKFAQSGDVRLGGLICNSRAVDNEKEMTKELMKMLSTSRAEGEKVADFEKRVKEEVSSLLKLD